MPNSHVMRVKNIALFALAVLYFIICRLQGRALISDPCEKGGVNPPSRDITVYLRENGAFLVFFLLFLCLAATSFLLGYLIYQKFDRNRTAAQAALRTGGFFLCVAFFIVTGTNSLDIFSSHVNIFDFISDLSLIFAALANIACFSVGYQKTWVAVLDWFFTALAAVVFLLGFTGVNIHVVHWLIACYNLLFMASLLLFSILYLRDNLRKRTFGRAVTVILGTVQIAALAAAPVLFALKMLPQYWMCFSVGLGVQAYVMFSDLIDTAARQYAISADAESYRKMAYVDALCNISNRNAFVLEQNNTYDSDSLYYVVFDVNNLKHVNDEFGHSEGDVIIRKAAEVICACFGEMGKCYRIGGDEFAVIGQYKTEDEICACLKNMQKEIDAFNAGSPAVLTLAYGYAIREDTGINTYELFNKADKAMYRHKRHAKLQAKLA